MSYSRFEAMKLLAARLQDELVIPSLGGAVDEWYNAAPHMREASLFQQQLGCVSAEAFGLAVGLPHRQIVSLDTDGGLLFNLGILATLGNEQPKNLFIVVWDNEQYQSIGGPRTHTNGGRVDLAAIARGAGVEKAFTAQTLEEFDEHCGRDVIDPGSIVDGESEPVARELGEVLDGGACLRIRDDGCGMSPEVLQHATEPFFTHRSDGSGTGLGLSMVDGFVHQSGGRLSLSSTVNEGTEVHLSFPPLEQPVDLSASTLVSGTAVVVDDDPAYLSSAAQVLEGLGFTVLRAETFAEGAAAITRLSAVDLVLSDLNLDHGASGWDLLHLARTQHPTCRLIVMSTRSIAGMPAALRTATGPGRLEKPVTDSALRDLLRHGA